MANFIVSTLGNDANAGTVDAPFRTVMHSVDTMAGGDTLRIRGGVYHEPLYRIKSGVLGLPTIIMAYENEPVTLDGVYGRRLVSMSASAHCILENLKLDGVASTGIAVSLEISATYISILNCEVYNTPSSAIILKGSHNLVDNCYLHDGGTLEDRGYGVYVKGAHNVVSNTEISGFAGYAIHNWDSDYDDPGHNCDYNTYEGNEFHHNCWSANYPNAGSVGIFQGIGNVVRGNYIHNEPLGCRVTYNARETLVEDNTFETCGVGIDVQDGGGTTHGPAVGTVLRSNVFISCAIDVWDSGVNTTIDEEPEENPIMGAVDDLQVAVDALAATLATAQSELAAIEAAMAELQAADDAADALADAL